MPSQPPPYPQHPSNPPLDKALSSPSHSTITQKIVLDPIGNSLYKHLPDIERANWEEEEVMEERGETHFEVEEMDQAGNVVATYIASSRGGGEKGVGWGGGEKEGLREREREVDRIDVVIPIRTNTWAKEIVYAFLPAGYPHSVTSDYMEYQIYDSMQAFSSSIASLLSSRAVLEGVGVGDKDATPTAALLLSVLQSSMGRIATILFAHRLGTALEPECKMYRLSADIFNDSSMILDCLSPAFPKSTRVLMYSISSVLRSLCGVAAGSSKASLSAHFAKWGNLGELNAKDSSQETIISLMGMLAGSLIVSHISTQFTTWTAMIFLLAVHLGTNYLAVRAVSMRTLNRQRANIVFSHYLSPLPSPNFAPKDKETKEKIETHPPQSTILTPTEVSLTERIFERDGVLRWNGNKVYGRCVIGVDLQSVLKEMSRSPSNPTASAASDDFSIGRAPVDSRRLIKSIQQRGYFLWYNPDSNRYQITLSSTSTVKTQLLAWFHALLTAREIHEEKAGFVDVVSMGEAAVKGRFLIRQFLFRGRGWLGGKGAGEVYDVAGAGEELGVDDIWAFLDAVAEVAESRFEGLWMGLEGKGWDLETGALETKSGTRVKVVGAGGSIE